MRWTVVVGVVVVLVLGGVVVALGGGVVDAPWSGENGDSDDGEPPNGENPGDDPNGTDEDDREENDTDVDDGSESEVLFETYARNVSAGNELDSGTLTVTNETGETVLTHDISAGATRQVEGLTPGETYTVVVTDPNEGRVPPGSEEFDPSETETVEVVAGYEIRGAQSHRNIYKQNETGTSFSAAEGAYAENGDAFRRLTNDPFFWGSSGIQFELYTDGETDRAFGYTRATDEWREGERFSLTDPLPSTPQLVQEPYERNSPDEWIFIEEQTITGSAVFETFKDENPSLRYHIGYISDFEDEFAETTVHVYSLSPEWSEEYDNELVYVDPDTGYIVRYEYDRYRDGNVEQLEHWVYESFAHADVERIDEYDLEEITNN